jgi:hypothetical protein
MKPICFLLRRILCDANYSAQENLRERRQFMKTDDSLKALERRAYRSTFEDGFYDITWGCLFLLFAWIPFLGSVGISRFYAYPFVLVLVLIPWLGKRYVTIPRLGAVEFGEKRKARVRNTALIGVAALLLMLPVAVLMFAKGFPGGFTWTAVGLIAAPVLAIGVFLMDLSRMYVYAILLFYSIVATETLRVYIGTSSSALLAFGAPGVAVVCYGFLLLLKFLKDHPKPTTEISDVSR